MLIQVTTSIKAVNRHSVQGDLTIIYGERSKAFSFKSGGWFIGNEFHRDPVSFQQPETNTDFLLMDDTTRPQDLNFAQKGLVWLYFNTLEPLVRSTLKEERTLERIDLRREVEQAGGKMSVEHGPTDLLIEAPSGAVPFLEAIFS